MVGLGGWGVVLGVLVCGNSVCCPPILSFMLSQIFAYSYTNFVVKSEGFFYIKSQSGVFVCLSPSIKNDNTSVDQTCQIHW